MLSTLQKEFTQDRREMQLELAHLVGEQKLCEDRLLWLNRKIAELREMLKSTQGE